MKIGVLTLHLFGNYGGMLQAYAMVKTLQDMGHNAAYLQYLPKSLSSFRKKTRQLINECLDVKQRILAFALKHNIVSSLNKVPLLLYREITHNFQKRNIASFSIQKNPAVSFEASGIDAVVVGSDQVWRDIYARPKMPLPFFFLDFVPEPVRRRSISYAASFGTATWGGDEQETEKCGSLLQDFKAVSVREHSGIEICKQFFGKDAVQMPDPTMLLNIPDYNTIIGQKKTWCPTSPYIATYILDTAPEINHTIAKFAGNKQIQPLMANSRASKLRDRIPMSVAQWLRLIRDSEYLITDSFHGCVFAIIFNKPFVCLGNASRGSARFDSLLRVYGLHNRMITGLTPDSISQIVNTPIDWNRVNTIRHSEQQRAFDFLKQHLDKD